MSLQALIWDVDGTLAETERDGHRLAFNDAFEALGLPWRWDEALYGQLLRITGGRERLLHDMASRSEAPVQASEREALARALHQRKNAFYAERVAARAIPLRPGVLPLMREALDAGLRLAIATTTSRSNWLALLRAQGGALSTGDFAAVVCGEDVAVKKPHPEAYTRALDHLKLSPLQTVAFEDSPGGAAAAVAAQVPVVVTRSHYFADAAFEACLAIGPGLHTRQGWAPDVAVRAAAGADSPIGLAQLRDWHQRHELVSQFP